MEQISQIPETAEQQRSRLQRLGIAASKLALWAAGSGMAGLGAMTVIPTHNEIGPHGSDMTITLDEAATFDLGPLGSIIKPSDGLSPLGVKIELKDNPGITSAEPRQTELSQEDIEQYAQMFTTFEDDIADAREALLVNWLRLSGVAGLAGYGIYRLPDKARRQHLFEKYSAPTLRSRPLRYATAAVLMTTIFSFDSVSQAQDNGVPASEAFQGTALEGTFIKGKPLQILVNKYGADILGYIQENKEFYDTVKQNLLEAFETERPLLAGKHSELMLIGADRHCNVGMGEVLAKAANLYRPKWFVSTGDETISGTAPEEYCIEALTRGLPDKLEKLGVGGNHDSEDTEAQQRDRGFTMLDGKVMRLDDLSVIGDDDPRRSVFGQPVSKKRTETLEQMSRRLADVACAAPESIDVALVHDEKAAVDIARRGCAKMILSGHSHTENIQFVQTESGKWTLNLVAESVGGARGNRPTLGPVQETAVFYVVQLDKETHDALKYQSVSVNTNGDVVFSQVVSRPREPLNENDTSANFHYPVE